MVRLRVGKFTGHRNLLAFAETAPAFAKGDSFGQWGQSRCTPCRMIVQFTSKINVQLQPNVSQKKQNPELQPPMADKTGGLVKAQSKPIKEYAQAGIRLPWQCRLAWRTAYSSVLSAN